jgi:hypothetical protein
MSTGSRNNSDCVLAMTKMDLSLSKVKVLSTPQSAASLQRPFPSFPDPVPNDENAIRTAKSDQIHGTHIFAESGEAGHCQISLDTFIITVTKPF